jgi:hypothetical protein
MELILSFLIGCIFTYLVTVISSSLKAATILEDAAATFAIMMMMGYETNAEQAEFLIANNELNEEQAKAFRKKSHDSFETYANTKIKIINKNIPVAHKNIIRFHNVEEMKSYVVELLKKQDRR